MTVSQAVERADQARGAQPLATMATTADTVKKMVSLQAQAFAAVLPTGIDVDRYSRLVLTAVKANPKLIAAFGTDRGRTSVLLSAMQAAALGLEPNTPTQECWLQPRNVKAEDGRWFEECELSIGYKGWARIARRSGQVRELFADVVREGDEFEWSRGLGEDHFHHKAIADEAAPLTHAYAVVRLANGATAFTVLTKAQVEKRRAMAESWKSDKARPFSPWTKWTEEQWKKTALKHLLTHGQVDLSPDVDTAVVTDERRLHMDDDGMIDALATDAPELGSGEAGTSDGPGTSEGAAVPPDERLHSSPESASEEEQPPVPATAVDREAPAPTDIDVAKAAARAFPCPDAPKGTKTKLQERLRYAVTWAETNRRTIHLNELTGQDRTRLVARLNDIIDGRMKVEHDEAGVIFTMPGSGAETYVRWADFEAPAASDG